MSQQIISIGTAADDGTGEALRTGGDKINDNFTELYAAMNNGGSPATVADRGIERVIYLAVRTDGLAGTGTASDPLDASTYSKLDAIFAVMQPYTLYLLCGGVFESTWSNDGLGNANGWLLKEGCIIDGQGISTMRLRGGLTLKGTYAIRNSRLVNGNVPNCAVRNCVIDGNLQNQPADVPGVNNYILCGGVALVGDNCGVDNCRFINYGSKAVAGSVENFLVLVGARGANSYGNFITRCVVDPPPVEDVNAYNTVLNVGGYINAAANPGMERTLPGYAINGRVEENFVCGAKTVNVGAIASGTAVSKIVVGVQSSASQGVTIRGNTFRNVATGMWMDTEASYHLHVTGNHFENVNFGGYFSSFYCEDFVFAGNTILYADTIGSGGGFGMQWPAAAPSAKRVALLNNVVMPFGKASASLQDAYSKSGLNYDKCAGLTIAGNTIEAGFGGLGQMIYTGTSTGVHVSGNLRLGAGTTSGTVTDVFNGIKTTFYQVVQDGEIVLTNTTGAAFAVRLPPVGTEISNFAGSCTGLVVTVVDYGNQWGTNNLTVETFTTSMKLDGTGTAGVSRGTAVLSSGKSWRFLYTGDAAIGWTRF